MSDYGLLQEVMRVPRATALTVAASVSDTELVVDDAGDLDPEGGTLELNGVQLDYTAIEWGTTEEDSDTVTLVDPLAASADVDDQVVVVVGGLAAEDWFAQVTMGSGTSVPVPLTFAQRSMWAEGQYDPPIPVAVAEDLSRIEDAPGRPATVTGRVEAWNEDEWDAAGDDTDSPGVLSYLPKPHSLMVFKNGIRLRNNQFTLTDRVVTVLASETVVRSGSKFSAYYDRDPAADVVGVGNNPDEVATSLYDEAVLAEPTLLAYYRHAETSGLVMEDSSGNNRDGVYSGDVVLGESAILTGDPDTVVGMHGAEARGVVPHGAWMDTPTFTVETWIDMDGPSAGNQYIIDRDTNARSWMMLCETGGNFRFEKIQGGSVPSVAITALDDTNRHMLVTTYDGSNIKLYLDGALVQTTACTGDMSTAADLAIGAGYAGDSTWWAPYYLKSKVSKTAIFSGAQSAAAILNRWTIGSTGAP